MTREDRIQNWKDAVKKIDTPEKMRQLLDHLPARISYLIVSKQATLENLYDPCNEHLVYPAHTALKEYGILSTGET